MGWSKLSRIPHLRATRFASGHASATTNIAGSSWNFQMPFIDVRHPATPDDDFYAEQKREFDRWRIAADIVRRLREAGISCELSNIQNRR
jgi:hypothetical protein